MGGARNAGIDCLRGLSIFLVVAHHIALRLPLKTSAAASHVPLRLLKALSYNGYEAVFLFFVISGFLITVKSLELWGEPEAIPLGRFYLRRASRIVPCLVGLVGILSVLDRLGARNFVIHSSRQSLGRAILSALALHLNWYEGHTGYLPANWDVLWSLSIEEMFYLVFPLACLSLSRVRLFVPFLLLLALSLPFSRAAIVGNPIWQEKAYLPGLAAIATGVLAALVGRRLALGTVGRRLLLLVGAGGLVVILVFPDVVWPTLGNATMLVLTFSTAALVLGSSVSPASLPGTGWLQSLGRLSYEIYLTHMFVVLPCVDLFRRTGLGARWGFLPYVPAVLLSWLLGWLVAHFFSVPCERALRQRLTFQVA